MSARDPLPLSSAGSLLAGVAAVGLIGTAPVQRSALTAALVGLLAFGVGVRLARRDHRLVGGLLVLGGVAGTLQALVRGLTSSLPLQLELYTGLVGLGFLAAGLAPVRRGWERRFVTAGAAGVLVAVVTSGVVRGSQPWFLLLAGAATVVAWDVGEQAVNLSAHVGSDARTWPVEVTHGAAGALVGVGALGLTMLVTNVDVSGLPLAGLAVLLGATVVLTAALYH